MPVKRPSQTAIAYLRRLMGLRERGEICHSIDAVRRDLGRDETESELAGIVEELETLKAIKMVSDRPLMVELDPWVVKSYELDSE